MKTMIKTKYIIAAIFSIAAIFTGISSCSDDMDGKTFLTSDDIMIDEYIVKEDPTMSTFLDMVDKAGFRGMLHAYGTYTCFIPTNEAIDAYIEKQGASSWDDLSETDLENFIKFHIVNDTLRTSDFVDGKLPAANLLNRYLTTRSEETGGTVSVRVNRQGLITKRDIYCANGYIHRINEVLTPNRLTIGEEIKNLSGDYSIFKSVMQKTGWIDSLSVEKAESWYTVFLQSDEAYAKAGIANEGQLLERLAVDRYDIPTEKERLWSYAAYQCVKGLYYVADLSYLSALQPQAPNQAITLKLSKDTLLINEYNNPVAGTIERGVAVDKESTYTDYTCANGVTIDMTSYIGPVKRSAMPVYWDPAEQPEIIKRKEFRKSSFTIPLTELSEISFDVRTSSYTAVNYNYAGTFGATGQYVNHDNLGINLYRLNSVSFKTPLLIEGTYNVWIAWRRAAGPGQVRGIFQQEGKDEQEMSNIINFQDYSNPNNQNVQGLLASGEKRYTAKQRNSAMNCRLLGTIVVESTGRHTLKLDLVKYGSANQTYFDMIQFIPTDHDQLWPRFDMEGKAVYPGTDCAEIYPDTQSCSVDNDNY